MVKINPHLDLSQFKSARFIRVLLTHLRFILVKSKNSAMEIQVLTLSFPDFSSLLVGIMNIHHP